MNLKLLAFFILNFGALALGSLFTNKGVTSDWYVNLNKAPWTPPGWVFGAAWTTIMICYSIYMAKLWEVTSNKKLLITLFALQWILNVLWNPIFFQYHEIGLALIVISTLTILMAFFLFHYYKHLNYASLLVLPYVAWLLIASSLNAYILLNN